MSSLVNKKSLVLLCVQPRFYWSEWLLPPSVPLRHPTQPPPAILFNSPVWVWHGSWMHLVCCPVAVSGQCCLLVHCLCFLQTHWSHCFSWVLMLFLLWPPSHQSLPGTWLSVPKTQECSHCARASGVCSEVKTVPQVPILFHILGLYSRHVEMRENGLSGFLFFSFGWCLIFTQDPSPWQRVSRQGQILVTLASANS